MKEIHQPIFESRIKHFENYISVIPLGRITILHNSWYLLQKHVFSYQSFKFWITKIGIDVFVGITYSRGLNYKNTVKSRCRTEYTILYHTISKTTS